MENRLRKLRDQAAEDVLRRIRRDREAHPRLRDVLTTIGRRLFDPDFNVAALWRETATVNHNASTWFRDLDPPTTPSAYIAAGRLDTAAEMLARNVDQFRVFAIAAAVGYNPDSFGEPFKTRFGFSPSEYQGRETPARRAISEADSALAVGNPWSALDHLASLGDADPQVAARLGIAWHCRAADETVDGKIDDAYAHLTRARHYYSLAGELPRHIVRHRRRTGVSCRTDETFLDALCNFCRKHLLGEVGASLCRHLRSALELLPTDLIWFRACCDGCYRVVWKAVQLARYGFLPDAWQAWWLAEHASLEDPYAHPSVGRFITALAKVEGELHFRDQEERLAMAERALTEAKELGLPLLEAEARMWRGNARRALARFSEARRDLKLPVDVGSPWLLALHHRFSGILEHHTTNYDEALGCYRTAAELYKGLDPHITGKLVFDMGVVHFEKKLHEKAIELYRRAFGFLDDRREPLCTRGLIPISLAVATGYLGDTKCAEEELARCDFDRDQYPALAANETFTRGCLAQLKEEPRKAVTFLAEAQRGNELLKKYRDAALAASQSVEGYYSLGEHAQAVRCCVSAARFFEAAGCPLDTLEAVRRLEALVRSRAEIRAVAAAARRLARRHGGWLPDPAG